MLDGDAARDAWEQWRPHADLDRLDRGSRRLLPQLYLNLVALGIDDPLLPRLRAEHDRHAEANARLFDRAGEAVAALDAAGVPTLVLKGAALAVLHYESIGARPMTDVDVLVPRAHARAAIAVLERVGFAAARPPAGRDLGLGHAAPFNDRDRRCLDLHWYALAQPSRDDELWGAAAPFTLGGVATRTLAPSDQLFHVCAHGAVWNPLPPIRWAADAAQLLRTAGDGINWSRIVDLARQSRLTVCLDATLDHLRHAVDAPVPAHTLAALRAHPVSRFDRAAQLEALRPPPRLRKSALGLLDRRRRLRELGDPDLPPSLAEFVTRSRGVEHLWQLPAHAVGKLRGHRRRRRSLVGREGAT